MFEERPRDHVVKFVSCREGGSVRRTFLENGVVMELLVLSGSPPWRMFI